MRTTLVLLIVLAAVGTVVVVAIKRLVFDRISRAAREATRALGGREPVWMTSGSNFMGQRSQGKGAIHGNAVFAVTDDEIYSLMWMPRRELRIPLRNVTGVELARTFMGRSRGRQMVKVEFRSESGEEDAAAWLVKEPQALRDLIRRLAADVGAALL